MVGARPVERLVERDAEGVDVAAGVRGRAAEDLGRDVGEGADDRPRRGQIVLGPRLYPPPSRPLSPEIIVLGDRVVALAGGAEIVDPDQAKVDHHHPTVVADEDIARLDVAVDEPSRVGRGDPLAGLMKDLEDLTPTPRLRLEPLLEGHPLDVVHHQEEVLAVGVDVVDLDDVGMGEAGEPVGLAEEATAATLEAPRATAAAVQQLERHLSAELAVMGQVDGSHAAGADVLLDYVAADPRRHRHLAEEVAAEVGAERVARRCRGPAAREERAQIVVVIVVAVDAGRIVEAAAVLLFFKVSSSGGRIAPGRIGLGHRSSASAPGGPSA